ncbi:hypothetical protein [Pseudomonas sp. EA_105y_Pfl2_R69]|uniref:hypothetical protein n=1 Tax=Pseudomonas sp. EA_105y_Pfl2_R69 TaxID=3088683 RepID=UPI0030D7E9AB
MKSDWDDAPDYMRNKKKESPWRMVIIMGVGSAITWGIIALFAKPIIIDVNQLKHGIRVGGQPVFSEQPAKTYSEPLRPIQEPPAPFESAPQVVQPPPSQADIEWSEQQAALAAKRIQTSFNDNNYSPKNTTNIMPATQVTTEPVARQQRRQEIVVVGKETRLRDYCPHPQGSIELRNCRMRADLESRNR